MSAKLVPDRVVKVLARLELTETTEKIARAHGLTVHEAFATRSRSRRHTATRAAVYLALRCFGWSYPDIGGLCGFDHNTVMHALRKTKRARDRQARAEERGAA